jgi:hypothetical protein
MRPLCDHDERISVASSETPGPPWWRQFTTYRSYAIFWQRRCYCREVCPTIVLDTQTSAGTMLAFTCSSTPHLVITREGEINGVSTTLPSAEWQIRPLPRRRL